VKFPVKENRFLGKKSAHLPNQIKRDHRQFFLHIFLPLLLRDKIKPVKLLAYLRFQLDFYWHI